MQFNQIDILKVVVTCAIFIAITLGAVHLSGQTRIPRTQRHSLLIAVRWTYVFAVVYFVFTAWLGVPLNPLLIVLVVVLILMPSASIDDDGLPGFFWWMDISISPVIELMAFIPVYLLKQFILGFPDRDKVILSPPKNVRTIRSVKITELPNFHDELATVVATLRPLGQIECKETRFDATSFDGKMIDVGQVVRICDYRDRLVIVRPIDDSTDVAG